MVLVLSSGKSVKNMPCGMFNGQWTILNAKRMPLCLQINASDEDGGHGDVSHGYCLMVTDWSQSLVIGAVM